MVEITINEALYVDPRAGNDKFYRTFAVGDTWTSQYGRNGQIGTFTKPVGAPSPEAAVDAAAKKFAAKVKKGYQPSRSGTVEVTELPTGEDMTWLDAVADQLPAGTADGTVGHEPVAPLELDLAPLPDATDAAIHALESTIGVLGTSGPVEGDGAPLRPMLATEIDHDRAMELVGDEAWTFQYKYDGDRIVIVVDEGSITVLNRSGQAKVRGISTALLKPFTALHRGRWTFDGEIVDRVVVLFDMISAADPETGQVWVDDATPFELRHQALRAVAGSILDPEATVRDDGLVHVFAPLFSGIAAKLDALHQAKVQQREGVIARELAGPYEQGRRSTRLLKHKFTRTADLVVGEADTGRESVQLLAFDGSEQVLVGQASAIGKGSVLPGQVWEVEFLYVVDPAHPRMVQPRLLRRRDDKAAHECTIDQFAHAGTDRSV